MIEVYKIINIINKIEDVKVENFFRLQKGITRGHWHKLFKKRVKLDVAKFSFGNRITEQWNKLPKEIVEADNIIKERCLKGS